MKIILVSLFSVVFFILHSQKKINISGQIINHTGKEIKLIQVKGNSKIAIATSLINKDGKFNLDGIIPYPDYYKLEITPNKNLNLILKGGDSIKVYSDEKNIFEFTNIVGSQPSQKILEFIPKIQQFNKEMTLYSELIKKNPNLTDSVSKLMQREQQVFKRTRDMFARVNAKSPALIVIYGMYDRIKEFEQYKVIANNLIQSFSTSPTIEQVKKELEYYIEKNESNSKTAIGNPAPEIDMLDLSRKNNIKLSDLKGKVVLLDFWASWCGPCRKENPNVVKLYNKYKDHGFTVYSVSLDNQLSRWKTAIQQDGLIWPNHVSDLKRFDSSGGKAYGVSSIPSIFLIGKDGKIIDKNIRGVQLEKVLESIFGF